MWIVWNNATDVTGAKGVLTLDGKEVYTEDFGAVGAGVHAWYFCFGENPGNIGLNYEYGTYVSWHRARS